MKHPVIFAILILALASLACGFNINIDPPQSVKIGPDQTETINVKAPAAGTAKLSLAFGAGEIKLAPGAGAALVQGTITYNVAEFKPEIIENGSSIQIKQGDYEFKNLFNPSDLKNDWDLKLGAAPMELSIEAGAYQGSMSLGGLSLGSLTIADGASQNEVTFDAPNKVEMSVLRYDTGASDVTLKGLANANFNSLIFKAGAGSYDLDFSGDLQRDATVDLDCGLSDLTLRIPAGVHAVVTVDGGLNNVTTGSGWSKNGDTYTQAGEGPTLTFIISMGAGNLTLTD